MMKRLCCLWLLILAPFAHADWATDRAGETGYVTVTTLASVIDEAVPFCVVYLSDLPSGFHSAMDAAGDTDGKTIRVSTSDGATQLACLLIGVNTSTDTGCLIFLGTGMSASVDVSYRIYCGNASLSMPSASGGMGEQAVFADYAGVYFPGIATRDWTAGGRTLTATGSPGTASSGYEGITAATYNGSGQYHSATQSLTTWPLTMEALAYSTDLSANQTITSFTLGSSNNDYATMYFNGASTDGIAADFKGSSGSTGSSATSTDYTTSSWRYAAANRSGNTGTGIAYLDGGGSGSDSTSILANTAFNRFSIGALRISAGDFIQLTGRVAWAAVSNSVRSANYIATQHQNWLGNLYSVGSWTPNSISAGTTGWLLFQTAAQTSTADADWATISNALVDDSNAATVTLDDVTNLYSETLKLTNPAYGTTIPSGAPSYTVEIRIKRSGQTSSGKAIHDKVVRVYDDTGTLVGDNLADTSTTWPSTATTKDYVLTGYTPDGTEFTSAFGIAIQADGSVTNGNTTTSVYVAWIKISWTGTDSAAKTRGFFALTE